MDLLTLRGMDETGHVLVGENESVSLIVGSNLWREGIQ